MTLRQLRKTARRWAPWWRDRLGLRDWKIDLEYTPGLDAQADCTPSYPQRFARIRLSADVQRWTDSGEDVETVVVHELLHIHFGVLGVGLGKYAHGKMNRTVLAEQVINALADILVDLRRGKRR